MHSRHGLEQHWKARDAALQSCTAIIYAIIYRVFYTPHEGVCIPCKFDRAPGLIDQSSCLLSAAHEKDSDAHPKTCWRKKSLTFEVISAHIALIGRASPLSSASAPSEHVEVRTRDLSVLGTGPQPLL